MVEVSRPIRGWRSIPHKSWLWSGGSSRDSEKYMEFEYILEIEQKDHVNGLDTVGEGKKESEEYRILACRQEDSFKVLKWVSDTISLNILEQLSWSSKQK